jgi:hypothetical protein
MPEFIRHHAEHHPLSSWAVSAFTGILVGFLLAIIVSYAKPALWVSSAAKAALAVSPTQESQPAPEVKKAVRYEAIISNWKQYRSTTRARE